MRLDIQHMCAHSAATHSKAANPAVSLFARCAAETHNVAEIQQHCMCTLAQYDVCLKRFSSAVCAHERACMSHMSPLVPGCRGRNSSLVTACINIALA